MSWQNSFVRLIGAGKPTYPQAVLADSPAGYWRLQETSGTTAADSSGNGNPGTYTGGYTLGESGPFGSEKGALFDGSTGYVTVPSAAILQLTSPFTLEMWAKVYSLSQVDTYTLDKDNDYALIYGYAADSYAFYSQAVGAPSDTATLIPIADANWHYVAMTYDGATMVGYLDGASKVSVAATFACGKTTDPLTIAVTSNAGVRNGYYHGTVAEVAVYPTALSAARVAAHYAASGL